MSKPKPVLRIKVESEAMPKVAVVETKKKCVTNSPEWKERWHNGMMDSFERFAAEADRRVAQDQDAQI